jgi:type IX secretion system substrate protein
LTLPYASEHRFTDIIPIHLDNDGKFELLALTELNSETTLSAFSHYGYLLDNFPIFENYTKIRVFYHNGDPQILVYDPAGRMDIYSKNANLISSLPAPVDASSLFIEQMSIDTAWVVSDGSIYHIASDSVYWGYDGKDAEYTNAAYATQTAAPIVSNQLIKNGLVYNYPNPIENGITKFRFFATGASSVSINIYQLSGAYVQTLSKSIIDQQWNEVLWDVSALESGVYIAKIEISNGSISETYFVKPAILK